MRDYGYLVAILFKLWKKELFPYLKRMADATPSKVDDVTLMIFNFCIESLYRKTDLTGHDQIHKENENA